MPNTILLKRSNTTGAVPAAGSLEIGELAINSADAKLYTKKTDGTITVIGGSTGNVTGNYLPIANWTGTDLSTFTGLDTSFGTVGSVMTGAVAVGKTGQIKLVTVSGAYQKYSQVLVTLVGSSLSSHVNSTEFGCMTATTGTVKLFTNVGGNSTACLTLVNTGNLTYTSSSGGFAYNNITKALEAQTDIVPGNLSYLTRKYADTRYAPFGASGGLDINTANSLYQPKEHRTTYGSNQPLAQCPDWAGEFQGDITIQDSTSFAIGKGSYDGKLYTLGLYYADVQPEATVTSSIEAQDASATMRLERAFLINGEKKSSTAILCQENVLTSGVMRFIDGEYVSSLTDQWTRNTPDTLSPLPEISGSYQGGPEVVLTGQTAITSSSATSLPTAGRIETLSNTTRSWYDSDVMIAISSNATSCMAQLLLSGGSALIKTDNTIATLKDIAEMSGGGGTPTNIDGGTYS